MKDLKCRAPTSEVLDERHDRGDEAEGRPPVRHDRHNLFCVQGSGCRVQGSGCRVQGAGFMKAKDGRRFATIVITCFVFRVQGAGFRVQGAGCRVQGS